LDIFNEYFKIPKIEAIAKIRLTTSFVNRLKWIFPYASQIFLSSLKVLLVVMQQAL
jgi:hypothetical protein